MTPFQQIQKLFPQLNSTDRKKLQILLSAFSHGGGKAATKRGSTYHVDDWLFRGIVDELASRGLKYHTNSVAEINRIAPNYAEDSALIRSELEHNLRGRLPQPKYTQLLILGRSAAQALAEYRSAPLGLQWMLRNVDKTLEAIDAAYPGYISSGCIDHLVRGEVRRR